MNTLTVWNALLCAVVSAKAIAKTSYHSSLRRHNTSTRTSIIKRNPVHLPSSFISNCPTTTTNTGQFFRGERSRTGNGSIRKIHHRSVPTITAETTRNMATSTTATSNYRDDDDDELVLQNTQTWIKRVVIDLNLCPFAEKSRSRSEIFTSVVRGKDVDEIIAAILDQCLLRKESGVGTSLIVCPDFSWGDFCGEYMEVLGIAEENLAIYDLEGHVQV